MNHENPIYFKLLTHMVKLAIYPVNSASLSKIRFRIASNFTFSTFGNGDKVSIDIEV